MITLLPTPIGNLEDISLRTLTALAESEIVLCEDTRITKRLISLLQKNILIRQYFSNIFADKVFYSFHSHNQESFIESNRIDFVNKKVVFLSDAGMPCVNDPGALLVQYAIRNSIPYDVLPGSSACLLAYCMSGVIDDGFIFGGFLPHKQSERKQVFESFLVSQAKLNKKVSVIFYESPHRLLDSLRDLYEIDEDCEVVAFKEMTKIYQKIIRGKTKEVLEILKNQRIQGEWVLLLNFKQIPKNTLSFSDIETMNLPPKIKAKLLAKISNIDTKKIYEKLIK